MILKVLGIMDFLSALALIALHFDFIGWRIALIFAALLALKAFAFIEDIASIVDLLVVVYFILLIFGIGHVVITAIFVIYLLQKAFASFL